MVEGYYIFRRSTTLDYSVIISFTKRIGVNRVQPTPAHLITLLDLLIVNCLAYKHISHFSNLTFDLSNSIDYAYSNIIDNFRLTSPR